MMHATLFKAGLRSALHGDFMRRQDGSISIEAMIVLPVMFWAFLAMFSIFDAFRTYGINQKAAFTVGDAISRETLPLDDDYLNGMHSLFEYLSLSEGQSALRVSSIWFDADDNRYRTDWSKTRGGVTALTSSNVRNWHDKLPVMPDNERVVLVETWSDYTPPFATGLENREIQNFVFTRPRYAPRVCWEECN
ncbi:hypothetical protein FIU94_10480 [Sulfitobacter sp. THAF37]|uniref:TadE/TadG family type IV pilus assembly protein n=1 Tax=Sulfitobacter sp. THAF37 TaxID=2587855 RepID=UPI0012A8A0BC|nr:hypothetical protein [Sulfitobacter sp. THAF37]QFT59251.1 hypothetical protein FIU94_10480 [Sulfitobacter sp. THAF37]